MSTGLSLLAVEVILGVLPDAKAGELAPAKTKISIDKGEEEPVMVGVKIPFDKRTRLEVITELRSAGVEAYPRITAGIGRSLRQVFTVGELFPLAGISNTTTVYCNESGEWVIYQSDAHGFRNPPGLWGQDRMDIVTVGDSFIHGECVGAEEHATALIRNVYPNTLNLGSSGSGPLIQLAIMKEYLPVLKPKTVLWFYYEQNDLSDLKKEYDAPLVFNGYQETSLRRYLDGNFSQNLVSKQRIIDQGLRLLADRAIIKEAEAERLSATELAGLAAERGDLVEMIKVEQIKAAEQERLAAQRVSGPRLSGFERVYATVMLRESRRRLDQLRGQLDESRRRLQRLIWFGKDSFSIPEELTLFDQVLRAGKDAVEAEEGDLYFVYLPAWERYVFADGNSNTRRHDQIISLAENAGLPVIDVTEAFGAHPRPIALWVQRPPGHYNAEGYRLLAETVLAAINAEN